ncbi:MAG: hypothetical protein ACOCWC_00085 [Bacteroidota bacterium]
MLRRIIVLSLLVLFSASTFAQIKVARRKDYKKFLESTTMVVLDQHPFNDYNERLKEEMERFWTITPYEFITFEEFEKIRRDDSYSFIILADIKQDKLPDVYQFMNFVLGDPSRNFDRMPDLGSVPLAYRDIDEDNYIYKMGVFVQYMQNQAEERSRLRNFSLTKLLDVKDDVIQEMELWLLEDELAPNVNSLDKIAKYYPYEVKLVTREEIKQAIADEREDVAILHKIGPEDTLDYGTGKTWKFIVTAKDGLVLYTNSHEVERLKPDAFLESDFKSLAK